MRHIELLVAFAVACQPGAPDSGVYGAEADASEGQSAAHAAAGNGAAARAAAPAGEPSGPTEAAGPLEQPREAPVPGDSGSELLRYDFEDRVARFELPGRLDEVSGLAITADGRLFAHDDERGRVHEIDRRTGEVGKRFDLGEDLARDDFEGVTIVGERFFLVSSRGLLYEFREGADRENVPYRVTDTRLGDRCEIEGLDYDPMDDALVLACKRATPNRHQIVIHRLRVDPSRPALASIRVDKSLLLAVDLDPDFQPGALAVSPSGSFILVSAPTEAILEIDRTGAVLAGRSLSKGRHPQPEGLAVDADGLLYIADEKNNNDARITVYGRTSGGPS